MPKLNKCRYRDKTIERIGQRRDEFHFGYHEIYYCNLDGYEHRYKCTGWNCGNYMVKRKVNS